MLVCFIYFRCRCSSFLPRKRHKHERQFALGFFCMIRGDKLNAVLPMMASIFECFLMLSREHVVIAMLSRVFLQNRNWCILLRMTTSKQSFENLNWGVLLKTLNKFHVQWNFRSDRNIWWLWRVSMKTELWQGQENIGIVWIRWHTCKFKFESF